jgi:hypothetical protein
MSPDLLEDFALQSPVVQQTHGVWICGGSVALLAACDRAGAGHVRVTGLRPNRFYVLAGANHRFARADDEGEALIAFTPDAPVLITLVPVI